MTDKAGYVARFSIEEQCRGGAIPPHGVVVDESSGTSGTPWNWVRGPHELRQVKQAMQVALHHQVGTEPMFVLNAFALGPWATGMNVSMSVVDIAILKVGRPGRREDREHAQSLRAALPLSDRGLSALPQDARRHRRRRPDGARRAGGVRRRGHERGDADVSAAVVPPCLRDRTLQRLAQPNQDYREAARFMPADAIPTIEWHGHGSGPFAGEDIPVKRHYIRRATS